MPFDFVFDAFVVSFWRCKDSKKRWEQRIERRMFYGKDERLTTFHARVRARFEKMRKKREVYLSNMAAKKSSVPLGKLLSNEIYYLFCYGLCLSVRC